MSSNETTPSHGLYKLEIVVIGDSRVLDLYFILFDKPYSIQSVQVVVVIVVVVVVVIVVVQWAVCINRKKGGFN